MKLEDMIMVVENRKGTETNFLTDLWRYMEMVVKVCDDSAVDMADAIGQLYGTKENNREWSELYFAENKSIHAAFCTGEAQLRGFLMGNFNDGEWSFDEGRCPKNCLEAAANKGWKFNGLTEKMRTETFIFSTLKTVVKEVAFTLAEKGNFLFRFQKPLIFPQKTIIINTTIKNKSSGQGESPYRRYSPRAVRLIR